jgi:hypothetical protein
VRTTNDEGRLQRSKIASMLCSPPPSNYVTQGEICHQDGAIVAMTAALTTLPLLDLTSIRLSTALIASSAAHRMSALAGVSSPSARELLSVSGSFVKRIIRDPEGLCESPRRSHTAPPNRL